MTVQASERPTPTFFVYSTHCTTHRLLFPYPPSSLAVFLLWQAWHNPCPFLKSSRKSGLLLIDTIWSAWDARALPQRLHIWSLANIALRQKRWSASYPRSFADSRGLGS